LAGAAAAEPTQLFYNERGQITGSASTSGNVTTFRDRTGKMTGTAERNWQANQIRYQSAQSSRLAFG
jgi:YD repeat-containing protein